MLIEVCANSVESAIAAQAGGADRVELCAAIPEGGTTPSAGAIRAARKYLNLRLYVIIRPRGGDFCYSDLEFEIMKNDLLMAKEWGADGVVFGVLKSDGQVNIERSRELVECARPLSATFHRAFDMTPDPHEALEQIIRLGADRILTSGQKNQAIEGVDLIAELVKQAGDRIGILVGSGVNENNIDELRRKTGAREFHVSGRKTVDSVMQYRKPGISMGGVPSLSEYEYSVTDAQRIRRIAQIV